MKKWQQAFLAVWATLHWVAVVWVTYRIAYEMETGDHGSSSNDSFVLYAVCLVSAATYLIVLWILFSKRKLD